MNCLKYAEISNPEKFNVWKRSSTEMKGGDRNSSGEELTHKVIETEGDIYRNIVQLEERRDGYEEYL